ncbi:hypothetical protein, variant 3 [Blastomyces gilchristii SLH14081]|uniref:ER-bound oxygenase mpaB/mpaB'/Rubber oxygenase catalytic domain-containing protein n=2 Tax=Blastomyces gilchristii (strain SLH14081) TaxID=559298 RepID=A0A179UGZ0_BLAGS|nr:hypothetical protein, variant 1 [Blastomyces gilchristii SLH14081]XP_031577548.1 hypothetical protein, variant 2 [Blastomyces gilchristii SLH14081]XP_031577549.1 hypothetical protein, variant 3 [Blastomyces gilchristii SLH14081]OAT07012.1 hypothetical protein, variant 1 [Blastomyces gilchristii SLH14081]OAT07013.1 hypothetical protein, variant 2 [Blastomyces gilchristii SLH14081]OAT07014.1 hypothetical protein, variant 3 [Blastomyces gilchristii SLH14081]
MAELSGASDRGATVGNHGIGQHLHIYLISNRAIYILFHFFEIFNTIFLGHKLRLFSFSSLLAKIPFRKMAIPNLFRRSDENTRTAWGYSFQWTPEHLSGEQMEPMKHSYDRLADECLTRLNEISPPPQKALPRTTDRGAQNSKTGKEKPKRDLYLLLRDNADKDDKLAELWNQVNTVPDWVDWDQIERGQEVFYRYGIPALNALGFESLLGGMGAGRIVETLARTGGFSAKIARHRMFETTQFVFQVTMSLKNIQPGGDGFASAVRVRLLHAAVRARILNLAKTRPDYYSVERFGVPVNDLDCISTIGSFSTLLVWLSLPRQGIFLREQEILDYIAFWRLVAYYLGTPTKPFESPEKARKMMESILVYEVNPTEMSKILANNIITSLENTPPAWGSRGFLEATARWLNGKELSDRLGIGTPGYYYYGLVLGYCIFVSLWCYVQRTFLYLDRRHIARMRRHFWKIILDEKIGLGEETKFDFKYVPGYDLTTEQGGKVERIKQNFGIELLGFLGLAGATVTTAAMGTIGYVTYLRAQWGWKLMEM